jgi:hypothetical protein
MKSYGIGAIIIFIVTFLLNLKNTDMGIFKKIFMKIALGLGSVAANIFLFYFIFKAQVTPTIDAVMRVF